MLATPCDGRVKARRSTSFNVRNLFGTQQQVILDPPFCAVRGADLQKSPALLDDFQPLAVLHGGHDRRLQRNIPAQRESGRAGISLADCRRTRLAGLARCQREQKCQNAEECNARASRRMHGPLLTHEFNLTSIAVLLRHHRAVVHLAESFGRALGGPLLQADIGRRRELQHHLPIADVALNVSIRSSWLTSRLSARRSSGISSSTTRLSSAFNACQLECIGVGMLLR